MWFNIPFFISVSAFLYFCTMKNIAFGILLFTGILSSCTQKSNESSITENKDTTKFFQLTEYLNLQISEVNKTPYFIYKIEIADGKKDSTVIERSVFNNLSQEFLDVGFEKPGMKKYYDESIFHDQTTKSFTISYTTTHKELPVQNVDILLEEDGQTIKRIFIRKFYKENENSIIEQLGWKPNHSFQKSRIVQLPDHKEKTYQTFVIWNDIAN